MNFFVSVVVALAAAAVSALAVLFASSSKTKKLESEISYKDVEISRLSAKLMAEEDYHRKMEDEIRKSGEDALAEVKRTHAETLKTQIEAMKASIKSETEDLLKRREEELTKKAGETYGAVIKGLESEIKVMREAFEANKKTQNETSSAMKETIAGAIKNLEESTKAIGNKADNLADALRGRNKMQGNWGETILQTLFDHEGFIEGVNYEKEPVLRDRKGQTVKNVDTNSIMRPDYIIHFPDGNDVVVDAKVSLAAFSDYCEAADDKARAEASARNLESVRGQVRNLAGKNYSQYLQPEHRALDYVIMFIPVYPALQLACTEDKNIWRDAFNQGVLITTEETLMPFLRMITIAWRNTEQVKNQTEIIEGASRMVARVADLVEHFTALGNSLAAAQKAYGNCELKLKDSGHSIIKAAQDVVRLGVPEQRTKNQKKLQVSDIELIEG